MPNDHPQIDEVFEEAIRRSPGTERAQYLDEVCGDNSDLKQRVERLLRAFADAGSFLEAPASDPSPTIDQPITERPGTQIGPYKLLEQIGEGGMGVVYMAEQKEPVARRVALKIIKPGMDTRQVIARFEAERQALAMMDHPNIAKVLDAGTTGPTEGGYPGRPYFVMELVNGIPVTQFCDQQHLTARERLELFIPICQAVQHAHQKGIIHRDIKPSNILVALYDDRAVPKVIDFGVAKATGARLTENTMFTGLGQIIGTIEYMSPEQAQRNQLDIDTRSDVYSLGVVLYELLTGDTPFDKQRLRSAAMDELLRIIREEEPPKPSTKLSGSDTLPSVAANRKIEPAKLSALVRGELDWIVMKALEKERSRRYETASAFAADVQHYLDDEAVVACPPSAGYRFRKFARRNKTVLVTSGVVAASLVAGIVGTSWQAIQATQERNRAIVAEGNAETEAQRAREQAARAKAAEEAAVTEAAIAKAVNDFLNNDLLGMADAASQVSAKITPDPNITLRTVVDRAADRIEGQFSGQPLIEAAIRNAIGNTYRAIGENEQAEAHHRRARDLREQHLGSEHSDTLKSMHRLASAISGRGRFVEAEELHRQTLDIRRRTLGDEHPDTLGSINSLATVISVRGRFVQGESLYRQTLDIRRRTLGDEHPDTLKSMHNLAAAAKHRGRYDEAEVLHRQVLEIRRRTLGDEHPDTLSSIFNLAAVAANRGRYDEAEVLTRQTLDIRRRTLGDEHPDTLDSMETLASAMSDSDEAEDMHRQVLEIRRRTLGDEHPDTLSSIFNLAAVAANRGRSDEAESLFRQTLDIMRRTLGDEHPGTLSVMRNLAVVSEHQGRSDEAESLTRQTLDIRQRTLGDEHPDTVDSMHVLAFVLMRHGRYDEAEVLHRQTLDIRRRTLGDEHPDTLKSMFSLAAVAADRGRYDEAESLTRQTLDIRRRTLGNEHPDTVDSMHNLAHILLKLRQYDEAEVLHRQVLDIRRRTLGDEHPETLNSMFSLAAVAENQGRSDEAESLFRQVLEIQRRTLGDEHPDTVDSMHNLAIVFMRHGRYDEAEVLHRQTLDIRRRTLGDEHLETLNSMFSLAAVAADRGRYDEAESLTRQTLDIRRRTLGNEHPDTVDSMHNLAHILLKLRQYDEAEVLHRQVLDIRRRTLGDEHPETLKSMFSLAAVAADRGRYDEAESLTRQTLDIRRRTLGNDELDPKLAMAHYNLGYVLSKQGKLDEAIACFRQAIEVDPKYAGAHYNLGNALMKQGKLEDAFACYRQAIELDPKFVDPCMNLAWFLATAEDVRLRDAGKAVEYARRAIELEPENANHWGNLGTALNSGGQWQAAVEAFEKADGMVAGGDLEHRMFFAMAHWQLGNHDQARELYDEGHAWIETNRKNWANFNRFRAEAELLGVAGEAPQYAALAERHVAEKRWLEAEADFSRAIELQPRAAWLRRRGEIRRYPLGKSDLALADFHESLRLQPDERDALLGRGRTRLDLGRYQEAVADFEQAVKLDPNSRFQRFEELVGRLATKKEWPLATQVSRKLYEQEQGNLYVRRRLAFCEMMTGAPKAYREHCRAMLDQARSSGNLHDIRNVVHACLHMPDALEDMSELLELVQKVDAAGLFLPMYTRKVLALALLRAGQVDEAISILHEMAEGGLYDAEILFPLAMAHHSRGETEAAREWLEKGDAWTAEFLAQDAPPWWHMPVTFQILQRDAHRQLGIPLDENQPPQDAAQSVSEDR